MHVGLVRAGVEIVDTLFPEALLQVGNPFGIGFCVEFPELWIASVDLDKIASFCVFQGDQANVGEFMFPRVGEEDAGEVVATAGQT